MVVGSSPVAVTALVEFARFCLLLVCSNKKIFVKVTLKPEKNICARILEKELPILEFSSEFCKNFEKTHFLQNLLVAATMLSFGWLIKNNYIEL